MKEVTVACIQIGVKPNNVEFNIEKSLNWLKMAVHDHEAELVVFPETITTGFSPGIPVEDFYDLVDFIPGKTTEKISKASEEYGIYVVWSTYEKGPKKPTIYNTSVLIGPNGEIIGTYRKTHPFPTERLEGGGWTVAGTVITGPFKTRFGKVGLIICYDGDFPEICRTLALKGAEIICRPSALLRSYDIWYITNCARAYDNHIYMVAVNSIGPDGAGNYYFGHSMIVNPIAWRLAQARGTEEIISAKLDPKPLKNVTWGSKSPMIFDHIEDRNIGVYDLLSEGKCPFEPARRIPYKKKKVSNEILNDDLIEK